MALIKSANGNIFKVIRPLGSGAFGTVSVCEHCSSSATGTSTRFRSKPAQCVVKCVRLARQSPKERFASVQELALMQQLRHRNLIAGVDAWLEGRHTACLAMEFCAGGDLSELLASRKRNFMHESDVRIMFVQV
jgi:serine/threonine protein kinase